MKNIAIYPGTFDPITYGHIDLIGRAVKLFEHVIVGIAESPGKKPLFTMPERVVLAEQVLTAHSNVSVKGFANLLSDFAKECNAKVILRGLRAVADFDYEFQLASMNRCLSPQVESVFLMPDEHYMYISSSLVREIAALRGDISQFVSADVVAAVHKKLGR